MTPNSYFFQKILAVLRIRPIVGGLEITDQVLRLVHFDGKIWQLHSMRLEPGVLENGKIKDREKFLATLVALKASSKIGGRGKNKKVSVVVSLGSVNVYSQILQLPAIAGEDLAKAVELNLQMASPGEASKTNAGWQLVGKDEAGSHLDILSAFIDRSLVDEAVQVLFEAGFLTMAIEPRSIALTRILREKGSGIDPKKSYLLLDIAATGIDFLVIRNNNPYFEYSHPWTDVVDERGEITIAKFEAELAASFRQVLNFYNQHWTEPIGGVIISAVAFHDEIEKAVGENSSLSTVRLTLEMGQPISSEWLVGIGCSLRGLQTKLADAAMNLLGEEWQDRFREEQGVRFLEFWEVLLPLSFGILIAIFVVEGIFLGNSKTAIQANSSFSLVPQQTAEMAGLEASTTAFNNEVAMIQGLQNSESHAGTLLGSIQAFADTDGVTISHLSFPGAAGSIALSGVAPSENPIIAFKAELEGASDFSNVNLPIADIQVNGPSTAFSMTFQYSP